METILNNEKSRQVFKLAFGTSDYMGRSIHELHKTETTEKIKTHYQEYLEKTRDLYHYVMDKPDGKITIVNSPFYTDDGEFAGVVEFIFDSSLA
ncbi:MAG: PAS domain-containing protein [Deltaproteobacteria bacterium]|nr:PAS domain-containing protein [Deltaproteobacteria bacterium]